MRSSPPTATSRSTELRLRQSRELVVARAEKRIGAATRGVPRDPASRVLASVQERRCKRAAYVRCEGRKPIEESGHGVGAQLGDVGDVSVWPGEVRARDQRIRVQHVEGER